MRNGTKRALERNQQQRRRRSGAAPQRVSGLGLCTAAIGACALAACLEPSEGPVSMDEPALSESGASMGSTTPAAMPGPAAPSGAPTAGAATPATEAPAAPLPMDVNLEDFTDGDGQLSSPGFGGAWRTYSDGTSQVTPAVDTPIVPVEGAVHVTGTGFSTWGVGLSVDLKAASAARETADLSAFRGLSIRARGTGSIAVELATRATTGTDEGGDCTGDGCFGHYAGNLTLGADYADHELLFSSLSQPDWAQDAPLDLTRVFAINFLSRVEGGPADIDLWLDGVTLLAAPPPAAPPAAGGSVVTPSDGSNPFAARELYSDGGAAYSAYNGASGADRDLLAKVALNPAAFWLTGGDPGAAGSIADSAGDGYAVLVAYNIPNRDCSGQSAGGAGSAAEYQGWVDGMSSSLMGKRAAVILEPDALAQSCGDGRESLIAYAVSSLRRNPEVAVYLDGGHSNWVPADQMATRLRGAGIEQATGFAINVSNFQPTAALISYGHALSGLVGGKPFVIDTSRNGQGARGAEWCNPAGAGLGEAPTANTGDPLVHAFLWVKRPGESDGACGQCAGTPAGQFCTEYALELARNAAF